MANPVPFQPPAGAHIIGQPVTVANISFAVNVQLTCNCAMPPSQLSIVASAPAQCPACRKTYIAVFNPQTGQVQVTAAVPTPEGVPS